MEDKFLFEEINSAKKFGAFVSEVPAYVCDNLKNDFWQWQKEAFENFLLFEKIKEKNKSNEPVHLMFNMATGTGKTMLMAGLILYYYKKGYRHFIFFVNQNNIVGKTETNFTDKNHKKYEFRQNIVIDNKIVNIRNVETFDNGNDIQIKFTSIHKLHNAVYLAKENSLNLNSLQKMDLVMIGDEAHHFNAFTKNKQTQIILNSEIKENASEEIKEKTCWENTIIKKILKKDKDNQETKNKNVLLEFTATIPKDANVVEKYKDKTIYKFELADFFRAGYTKEINIISTTLKKKDKILLAVLFNWYRDKIAFKNNISNFKPVILFRSKFIEESRKDYADFLYMVKNLKSSDLNFLENIENSLDDEYKKSNKTYEQGASRIRQMITFIKNENILKEEIVNFIKDNFTERNCIITNSKDSKATTKEITSEDQNKLLNNLEDKNNHIRAIFSVKKLTEGWDVLNLFDIVRLYEGQRDQGKQKDSGTRKAGEATIQEVQLIGRGVRYNPFEYKNYPKSKRKFDSEPENEVRILEEFYFHSSGKDKEKEGKYISELKTELKKRGIINDNKQIREFSIKNKFKDSNFYKEIKIWKNNQIDNPQRKRSTINDLKDYFDGKIYKTRDFSIKEENIILGQDKDKILAENILRDNKTIKLKLKDLFLNYRHIVLKAINICSAKDMSILMFENLRKELNVESIDDLFTEKFLGNFIINIVSDFAINFNDINNNDKLDLFLSFFEDFSIKIKETINPYKGGDFEALSFEEIFGKPKIKAVDITKHREQVIENDWFILDKFIGTTEEEGLLNFIKNKIENLKSKYSEIYLLKNEEVYKIFDFEYGRGFEPDFLLFLKGKEQLYYQVFAESKGDQFKDTDDDFTKSKEGWKQEFLKNITKKFDLANSDDLLIFENKKYRMVGLPFYNSENMGNFSSSFNKYLLDSV